MIYDEIPPHLYEYLDASTFAFAVKCGEIDVFDALELAPALLELYRRRKAIATDEFNKREMARRDWESWKRGKKAKVLRRGKESIKT